jgi:predicted amidohydrolase
MRTPLTIAVAQPPCVPYDVAANADAHAALVRRAGTRLVVFPELSLTGYHMDAANVALDDPRLAPVIDACTEVNALALVGAPLAGAAGQSHIGLLAVDRGGVRIAYRKLYPGDEEAGRFAPGPAPVVVDVDGWRLGLAICRDTSIPRHSADTAELGIDVYVASALMFDHETGLQNERSAEIARRHRVWVAVASFAGSTGEGYDRCAGCSGVWAPDGRLLSQAGPAPGAFARADLGVSPSAAPAGAAGADSDRSPHAASPAR